MPDRSRPTAQLREDALAIWRAGVSAVDSERLLTSELTVDSTGLSLADWRWERPPGGRVCVVGAGKAGAGMVRGLETAFGPEGLQDFKVSGWVNVPADCLVETQAVYLHAARPAGQNEPTEAGVHGSEEILSQVGSLTPRDLCLCLLSGGGSALLPAPAPGVSLEEKRRITQRLSSAGANIVELNQVRRALSRIKGGGLARACRAGWLVTIIISDVPGDPLEIIASGPTCVTPTASGQALQVWRKYAAESELSPVARGYLSGDPPAKRPAIRPSSRLKSIVVGNNAVAVDAAGMEAERRGYSHAMHSSREPEGNVADVAAHQARMARRMRDEAGPDCLISGGEPTVRLPASGSVGKGGRNQQLVLEATAWLAQHSTGHVNPLAGLCLLAGGTDGEDGPTDAAGAWVDADVYQQITSQELDLEDARRRCDAYPFWQAAGSLLQTGPTHTNVCDLRVTVVSRREPQRV